ncbi:TRAP transporter small permease [Salinarimonas ramus]|uniref:TRAP transporter small permease protein n=1 Tax=Salinarimonas ramus TaxID=690164 RepID=A0A917V2C5_9HYPH|nr:TRAP transporter small permease [Salinarimonas ramus]GGK27122.1 C4-dicarboxylate ABC transporter permease [Salinarimonas ramus]
MSHDDPLTDVRDTTRTEAPENLAPHARVPVKIEEALGAAAMALIVAISFGNVVVRYLTNVSFAFTEEFSVFLLVFMTFVGASAAFATNEHIRITFFLELMGPRTRLLAEAATLLATTAMFALIVYYGAQVTWDEWYWEETSPGLGYPAWIYTVWLPLLSLAILGRVIGRAIAVFRGRVR